MQKNEYIILGIDPGTVITGYGIIRYSAHEKHVLDYGCIRPPAKAPLSQRYLILFQSLQNLVHTFCPHHISVETQFIQKNVNSAIKLGMARAMAILAGTMQQIPIFEYAPRKAKAAVVGTGAASKYQVQKMIQIHLHLPELPQPEDAADALALALCHGHTLFSSYPSLGAPV